MGAWSLMRLLSWFISDSIAVLWIDGSEGITEEEDVEAEEAADVAELGTHEGNSSGEAIK